MKNNIIIGIIIGILIIAFVVGGYLIIKFAGKTENQNIEKITNNTEINTNEKKEMSNDKTSNKNVAVIYFSVTGNTKQVAEYIKDETNAEIFEIIPKKKYTSEDLNYEDNNTRATREQNDKTSRPEIENKIDVSNYNTIFLGYPIWWGDTPRIIQTFMESTNLSGKTVIPFCTSGSSSISTSENTLKSYNTDINWIKGNRFSSSSSKTDIKNWIDSLYLDKIESINNKGDKNSMSEFIIEINNRELIVEVQANSSSKALLEKLKEGNLIVNAHDYGNFEKVGDLGFSLSREDTNITTSAGDIVLYQGNQISLFYNSNSWSYTKLGKIKNINAEELQNILGDGNVTMILKLK